MCSNVQMDSKEMDATDAGIIFSSSATTAYKKNTEEETTSIIINFGSKLAIITGIYFFGYQGWSLGWLYCIAIAWAFTGQFSDERKRRWDVARAMALGFEKELLSTNLQFLPSWVHFPDIERVEWLNRIIRQVWVRVNHYTRDLVPVLVEPVVQAQIRSFKFDSVVLGHVPLRIDGVKVYDEDISRNKIVMDVDISYAGDCRITFQTAGMKGGIEDFQLRGRLRVVLKPLISSIPLIGGVQAYFMEEPEIDFELVGVAQLLAIPGLRNILQKSVLEAINSHVLFPNMYTIKLSNEVDASDLKVFEPEGILRVHVVEAKHLMKKDISLIGKGKSDPYAVLTVGPKKIKTMTIDNTVDPQWDFWCEFAAESNWELNIHVWDKDEGSKDESLGSCNLSIHHIVRKGSSDLWIPLQGVMHGMIHIRVFWMTQSSDSSDLDLALEETKTLGTFVHSSLLMVYLESAKNLQTKSFTLPDPYAVLQVDKTIMHSSVESQTCNPLWEQGFVFLVYNPRTARLNISVTDKKNGSDIGELSYKLGLLLERNNLEIRSQPFVLSKAGPECTIRCSLKLRILKRSEPLPREIISTERQTEDVEEQPPMPPPLPPPIIKQDSKESIKSNQSKMFIESEKGEKGEEFVDTKDERIEEPLTPRSSLSSMNIPMRRRSSIPDPYVKLYLLPQKTKESKRKTRVIKDNCDPKFDETFEYPLTLVELNSMQLEVTVSTEKKTFDIGNNVLGQVVIDLGKHNLQQTYFRAWFDLRSKHDND